MTPPEVLEKVHPEVDIVDFLESHTGGNSMTSPIVAAAVFRSGGSGCWRASSFESCRLHKRPGRHWWAGLAIPSHLIYLFCTRSCSHCCVLTCSPGEETLELLQSQLEEENWTGKLASLANLAMPCHHVFRQIGCSNWGFPVLDTCRLVSRLDHQTSGVLPLAIGGVANQWLQMLFASGQAGCVCVTKNGSRFRSG